MVMDRERVAVRVIPWHSIYDLKPMFAVRESRLRYIATNPADFKSENEKSKIPQNVYLVVAIRPMITLTHDRNYSDQYISAWAANYEISDYMRDAAKVFASRYKTWVPM